MVNFKELLKQAMLSKNELEKNVLRLLISDQEKLEKSGQVINSIKIVQKAINTYRESLSFHKNGDIEIENRIKYLESFLPTQITEEKLIDIIGSLKEEFGLFGMKDMKVLIGLVNNRVAGQITSKLIGEYCKKALS